MRWLASIGAVATTLLVLDTLWLHFVMRDVFKSALGDVALDRIRLVPAALFYLGYVGAIMFFAVMPSVRDGEIRTALLCGALLGLVAYGTYDLTNMATLKPWTWKLLLLDVAWGTFVTAISTLMGVAAWYSIR